MPSSQSLGTLLTSTNKFQGNNNSNTTISLRSPKTSDNSELLQNLTPVSRKVFLLRLYNDLILYLFLQQERAELEKAEKIRIALEKIKEANIKKVND